MHSRVPLSIIFSSPGRRHSIPHRTFKARASSGFFRYLDSNDTRLPFHRYLNAYSHPPEEYNTYVGEDVWDKQIVTEKDLVPDLVFDDVVEWVAEAFEEDWAKDGVVLCGRYVVANDCAWAVPSRSVVICTPREAFMVMRNSSKFLHDIHAQLHEDVCSNSAEAEFTLAKALVGEGAKEIRVFVPYRLIADDEHHSLRLSPPLDSYAAVCQRMTDVCFPALMAWTESDHHENFNTILKRVQQAQLLERAYSANTALLSKLWQAFWENSNQHLAMSATHGRILGKRDKRDNFILMLAVDVLFECSSLPIYILSAKMRLFFAISPELLKQEAKDRPNTMAADLPLLETCSINDGAREVCPSFAPNNMGIDREIASLSSSPTNRVTEDEAVGKLDDILSFFRLIRDEANWNRYVNTVAGRYAVAAALLEQVPNDYSEAATVHTSSCEVSCANEGVSHYCIVASDPSDLVTCREDLAMRGLPLEFINPKLLQVNPEAINFLESMRDKLINKSNGRSS